MDHRDSAHAPISSRLISHPQRIHSRYAVVFQFIFSVQRAVEADLANLAGLPLSCRGPDRDSVEVAYVQKTLWEEIPRHRLGHRVHRGQEAVFTVADNR